MWVALDAALHADEVGFAAARPSAGGRPFLAKKGRHRDDAFAPGAAEEMNGQRTYAYWY